MDELIKHKDPYKEVLDIIKFHLNTPPSLYNHNELNMLKIFINLLGKDGFNSIINSIFEYSIENKFTFEQFFEKFQKMIRQTDFYTDNTTNIQYGVGGNIDMLFWNFICLSGVTSYIFKWVFKNDEFNLN